MAFDLPKVLKALLFSSSQPLAVKDIQAVFARFHEQAAPVLPLAPAAGLAAEAGNAATEEPAPGTDAAAVDEAAEVADETSADDDLYRDVPSLVTATQIREALEAIATELRDGNATFLLTEGPTGFRLVVHPRFARWVRILRAEPPPVKLTQSALETLAVVAYRQPVTRTEIETIRGVSAEAGLSKLLERELVYIVGRADLPGRPLQYGTTDKFLEFVGVKSLVELPSSDVLSPRQIDEWLKDAINPKPLTDAEMGLPLEEGEGDSPNFEPVTLDHHVPTAEAETRPAPATGTDSAQPQTPAP